jgi:hypothetical protein
LPEKRSSKRNVLRHLSFTNVKESDASPRIKNLDSTPRHKETSPITTKNGTLKTTNQLTSETTNADVKKHVSSKQFPESIHIASSIASQQE